MNDNNVVNTADALFNASGRAFLVGPIAGTLLAAFSALAQLPISEGDLAYAAPIVAGVVVVLFVELCALMLDAKSLLLRLAASTLALLLLAGTWLLARKVPPFHASLLVLLGSSGGAWAVDFAARRWRGEPGSMHFLWIAAGACLGSALGLLWVSRPELSWMHSYGLGALSGIPAGMLIHLAARVRAVHFKPPGSRSRPP